MLDSRCSPSAAMLSDPLGCGAFVEQTSKRGKVRFDPKGVVALEFKKYILVAILLGLFPGPDGTGLFGVGYVTSSEFLDV
jgi:hypothetical protein